MKRRGERFERAVKLTQALLAGQTLTRHDIVRRWGVSADTAQNDLQELQALLPVERVPVPAQNKRGRRLVYGLRRTDKGSAR